MCQQKISVWHIFFKLIMKLHWVKTSWIIKKIFSNFIWSFPETEKVVYLTFDDGPVPGVTDWVLDQLDLHHAKATFFCIGDNIRKNPELFERVLENGHAIGNHTFNHLNGWKTDTKKYIENTILCESDIIKLDPENKKLFRPPYGKIKASQSGILRKMGYRIVLWDILSVDYDQNVSPEKCLDNVLRNINPGSIIIFHDSQKAFPNLEYALPRTLNFLKENGYESKAIA